VPAAKRAGEEELGEESWRRELAKRAGEESWAKKS
jgi:hypothetical protein